MRVTLIVNPHSGRGAAGRVADGVASALRAAVPGLEATVTADAAATSRVAAQAARRGDDVVAVLGGDGTAHLAAQAVAGTATALAVLPSGSGNDLAAALGLPTDAIAAAEHVAELLASGQRRRIDVGRIAGAACFSTVLCTGFDASVNARANAMRWPAGPRRYDLAVLAELAALAPRPVRVQVGGRAVEFEAILVAVGNGPCYGGGLRICPDATLTDGLLDVIAIAAVSRRRLLRVFPSVRTGAHVHEPEVTVLRGATVRIDGDPGWPVYADGEPQGTLPVTLHCESGALTVVA
ncbi:MAG TPA: diacylglycerol kinase family protein [Pseudonocardiaceae bacterium]|nr:diacylglycerol kinase family protein [Pseudonocardiaceae bacterium]